MGSLVSLDVVYLAALFVVPGYVFSVARGYFIPTRSVSEANYVKWLTLSGVNFALLGWLGYLNVPENVRGLQWAFILVVGPGATAVVSAWWTKNEFFRRAFSRLKVDAMHHIPTSWDYAFNRTDESWILVALKDGTKFAGVWGSGSFASSDERERDIYIEQVYDCPDNGQPWTPTNRSVLVAAGEVRSVEFIDMGKAGD